MVRLIQHLGLEERVFLCPFIPHDEILRVIEDADLGVDPKRTDGFANEALGGKIFEFMALGVPMVVSDTRTNKRYFNESVVRFCRGGDAEDLAQSILALHQDKEATSRLVQNAREFVRGYEWDTRISIYLKLIDCLAQAARKMQARRSESIL